MCETCGCHLRPAGHLSVNRVSVKAEPLSNNARLSFINSPKIPTQNCLRNRPETTPTETFSNADFFRQAIMETNNNQANLNRQKLQSQGIFTINLMSSPGAGKTSLLEATIRHLRNTFRIAVIEGDLETENDANRIRQLGIPAVQITTGSACHLDAEYIKGALEQLDLKNIDLLFIENVGNLVCPAAFDLGQHKNIVLLSVTEGDDKPLKYPVMFQKVDGMLITKVELLEYFDDFDINAATNNFHHLANHNPIWSVSAKTDKNIDVWCNWLRNNRYAYPA